MLPGQSLMGHLELADGSVWNLSPQALPSLHVRGSAGWFGCSPTLEMSGGVHLPFLGQSAVTPLMTVGISSNQFP